MGTPSPAVNPTPAQVAQRLTETASPPLFQVAVAARGFRADLYHRLSVYPVRIPPLRERGAGILLLAGHFIEQNRTRLGVRSFRLSPRGEQALLSYSWPGNLRELEHVISRAALKALGRAESRQAIVTLEIEPLGRGWDSGGSAPPAAAL
jgi:anaerobic nitric oxide reductase transcription regulator